MTAIDPPGLGSMALAARLAHALQTPEADALRAGWRARARTIGAPAAMPLAEMFTIVRLD